MTIREYINLNADAKRAMSFADVRAIVEPLKRESLATISSVIVGTYGDDNRVKLWRTKTKIINMLMHSLFDLKENCDRNI